MQDQPISLVKIWGIRGGGRTTCREHHNQHCGIHTNQGFPGFARCYWKHNAVTWPYHSSKRVRIEAEEGAVGRVSFSCYGSFWGQ
jgi:hypothetical protein